MALGKSVDRSQLRSVIQRMEGPEAASMMRQMELDLPVFVLSALLYTAGFAFLTLRTLHRRDAAVE